MAHVGSREVDEPVAVTAMFGLLNRWGVTMATILEGGSGPFAGAHRGGVGWSLGERA